MKNVIGSVIIFLGCALFFSCNLEQSNKDKQGSKNEATKGEIRYKISSEPELTWTAYKFTNKVGVSGTFNKVNTIIPVKEGIPMQLLNEAQFIIRTSSVNTNLELRDERIYNSFFKEIKADTIKGKITEVEKGKGKGKISLTIGNVTNKADFTYAVERNTLVIHSEIDLLEWNAQNGIESLNSNCKLEHTGSDGLSKLWPMIDIDVRIPLIKIE